STESGTGAVRLLWGNGDGTFGPPSRPLSPYYRKPIVFADFNLNQRPDLAMLLPDSNQVAMFPGRGDGTFGAAAFYAVGQGPIALLASDLNSDGALDLAVLDAQGSIMSPGMCAVSVFLGKGDGTFLPENLVSLRVRCTSFAAADFDADGHTDLVVGIRAPFSQSGLFSSWILRGNGDGTFVAVRGPLAGYG